MDKIEEDIIQKHVDMWAEKQKAFEEGYNQALEDITPSEMDKAKIIGQGKMQISGLLNKLIKMHGYQAYIPHIVEIAGEIMVQTAKRWNGFDIPIDLDLAIRKNEERRR